VTIASDYVQLPFASGYCQRVMAAAAAAAPAAAAAATIA